jgi:hypothetical protein
MRGYGDRDDPFHVEGVSNNRAARPESSARNRRVGVAQYFIRILFALHDMASHLLGICEEGWQDPDRKRESDSWQKSRESHMTMLHC